MEKVIVLIWAVFSYGVNASELDCDVVKSDYVSKNNVIRSQPSSEGLKEAANLYRLSGEIGKCLYPDVSIRRMPLGEVEHIDDAPILEIRGFTLTDRIKYQWGDEVLVEAVLNSGKGFKVETTTLQSGQIVISASKSQ